MREHTHVRQIPGGRRRRWFFSDDFDLIVWFNDDSTFAGFELCYDKRHIEHSLVWRPAAGFAHMAVDDGENRPGKYKASPVLVPDGYFDAKRIHSIFAKECLSLPKEVADYVLQTLEKHPNYGAAP
jgi:hypothetical protein